MWLIKLLLVKELHDIVVRISITFDRIMGFLKAGYGHLSYCS